MSVLVAIILKISVVVLMGLAAAALLRKRSAAVRHWILAVTIVCASTVPLFEEYVPAWEVGFSTAAPASTPGAIAPVTDNVAVELSAVAMPVPAANRSTPWADVLVQAWTVGAGISVLVLLVGFARLTWLASRARPVEDGKWLELADRIRRDYGLRRPVRLLESEHPSLLVTWGFLEPKVIIPRAARGWSDARIAIVLRHELAHVRRGDWLVQIVGELMRSVYWFNPLLWIACRRLRLESEQACDDEVMAGGVDGEDYATHLLELARALKSEAAPRVPAPAVARSSSLERRIRAMLDARLTRTPATRSGRFLTAAALMTLTVAIAAAQTGPVKLTGSILDPTGAPVPGVTVALVNPQTSARHEVTTDSTGYYEFVPLPADDYKIEVEYPGFSRVQEPVRLSGSSARRDVTMALGTLEETVKVGRRLEPDSSAEKVLIAGKIVFASEHGVKAEVHSDRALVFVPDGNEKPKLSERQLSAMLQKAVEECKPSTTGGRIRPPRKIRDVRPIYPSHLQEAGINGTVRLRAVIATDGSVREVMVEKPAHPELDIAAVEAVRQWKFDGTLLNCAPVEVAINVSVTFE